MTNETLLDANVLIALIDQGHVHHDVAESWLIRSSRPFATCPVTEGALVRFLLRHGGTATDVAAILVSVSASARHRFWSDDVPFEQIRMSGVVGHRQVTDAYLAALARRRRGRLATLDRALAVLHDDVADLIDAER